MIKGDRGDNIQERLRENDGRVQLEPEKWNFRPIQKKNVNR